MDLRSTAFIVFFLSALPSGQAKEKKCKVGDKEYKRGENFPPGNGCYSCTCSENGLATCTQKSCTVCTYKGRTYTPGETVPSTDRCKTCTCSQDGSVGCTEKTCATVCKHGYVLDKDGCKTCKCKGEPCQSKTCGADEYCNGSDCCPKWAKTTSCKNSCSRTHCTRSEICQPYCRGCLARCRSRRG